MQKEHESAKSSRQAPLMLGESPSKPFIERTLLVHTGLVDNLPERLSYDDVYSAFLPASVLSPRQVRDFKRRFQGTLFESIFANISEDEDVSVERIYQQVKAYEEYDEEHGSRVCLGGDWDATQQVTWVLNGTAWSDDKYDLDWHMRASRFRLAVQRVVPDIYAPYGLDKMFVAFVPGITNQSQFMLREYAYGVVGDDADRETGYNRGLYVAHIQYRIFELDEAGIVERDILPFLEIGQCVGRLGYDEVDQEDIVNSVVFLSQKPVPGSVFSGEIHPDLADNALVSILAPLPPNTQFPRT